MAKKKKKSWIEQRDEMIKAGADVQSAKGDFSPSGNARAKMEEEHARVLHAEGVKGTTKNGSAFNMSVDPATKAGYQNDRYNSHLVSNLGTKGVKVPVSALQSYKGAADFLASQGIDASDLMTQKDYIKKSEKTYNQGFDLQDFVYRANKLDPNKTATQLRQSYNDINAVKGLANTRKSAEQLLKDVDDYEKKYGKSDATKAIRQRAKMITDYINQNARGGSAASNEVVETREAMFKPTKPGELAPVAQVKNKYAAINDYNLEEKYGKVKYNGVKKETTYDYDELLTAKTPREKEFADAKRYQLNPERAYQDNKKIIKGLGDSKEDKERKTTLEETNNYYLYQKGQELQKKTGMDDNSMILLADGSRKGEYYMFGSDIPGYADGKQQDSAPSLSAPKKGSNTDTWLDRLEFTGNSYSFDDPRDYKGKGGVVTDEHGVFKVSSKDDMIALLQQKGLSKEDANIYLDYAKDYGSKRWEKMNYEAGKEAGEKNSALKNLAIDIGMSATSVPRAILGQTGMTDDFEKDLRAKEQGFEETKKKDMNGAESFLYDVGETVGSIALNSAIYGGMGSLGAGGSTAGKIAQQGATALPFATKAAQDSYYTALDKGASETEAKLYGAASGLITELIYGVKIGNLGKIAKGEGSGIVSGLAKKIVNGEVAPSVGKAALASVGKGALKGGVAFGRLTAEQRVADMLTQTAILGDKSDINLIYQKYLDKGLSEDEAWKETAKDVGVQFGTQILEESAKGAIMGAGGAAYSAIRQAGTYNEMRDTADTLKADYDKYTADKSSPYFENVETQEDLQEQFRKQSRLLHPDTEGGSEEAFTSMIKDKERIEGILGGEYSKEANEAVDRWENFVNQARTIIGEPKQMTTRMKEQFAKDYGDAETRLLELRDKIVENTTPETEAESTQLVEKIDTQLEDVGVELDETFNAPDEVEPYNVENFEPTNDVVEPKVEIEPMEDIYPSVDLGEVEPEVKAIVRDLGKKSKLPNSEVDKMVDSYTGEVSPRIYTNTYNMFYLLGKEPSFKSLRDVFKNMPEYVEYANDITPDAAGVAFSAGKSAIKNIEKIDLSEKPTGKFVNETGKSDDITQYMSDKANRTGLDIYFTNDIPKYLGEAAKGTKGIEGFTKLSKGRVFVMPEADNVVSTLEHEISENIKNLMPEEFEPLEKYISTKGYKILGAKGFDEVINKYRNAYPDSNDTELRKEYVCDVMGTIMSSPDAVEKFYEGFEKDIDNDDSYTSDQKVELKKRIREFIDKIIATLKNYLKKRGVKSNTEFVLDETVEGTDEIKTLDDAIDYTINLYDKLKNKINTTETKSPETSDTQYSKAIETEYDKAIKEDNMDKAAELVKEYAASKGYTEKVYHGTQQFGFTQIDLNESDDKMTFWATNDIETASTYSGTDEVKNVKDSIQLSKLTPKDKMKLLNEAFVNDNEYMFIDKKNTKEKNIVLNKHIEKTNTNIEKAKTQIKEYEGYYGIDNLNDLLNDISDNFNKFKDNPYKNIDALKKLDKAIKYFNEDRSGFDNLYAIDSNTYEMRKIVDSVKDNEALFVNKNTNRVSPESLVDKQIAAYTEHFQGNYQFFANTDNFLTIDAKGKIWSEIPYNEEITEPITFAELFKYENPYADEVYYEPSNDVYSVEYKDDTDGTLKTDRLMASVLEKEVKDNIERHGSTLNTRKLAIIARNEGYEGVKIKSVKDNGGRANKRIDAATVYIFFNPTEQVKSADPVTYDDNGKVVPLEKRFDKDYNDIRFSLNPDKKEKDTEKELVNEIRKNERLSFLLEKAEREVKRTNQTHKISSTDISKTVNDLKKDLDSKIDGKQLFRSINRLYTAIAKSNNLKSSDNVAAAESIIRDILDYPRTTKSEKSSEVLRSISNSPIYIDEKVKKELEYKYGSYKSWKDKYFGTIKATDNSSAKDISETWSELKDKYPDVFTKDPINEQDMIIALSDAIDDLKDPEITPLEEQLMMTKDDIISTYAVELLTRYANTPKSYTMADELYELRAEKKDAFIKAKIAGKAQGREEQRAKNALEEANRKERKIDKDVKKYGEKLYKIATEPTYHTKGHLTQGWAKEVAEFAELFNYLNENSEEFYRIREENSRKRYLDALKNNESNVGELKQKWEHWDELYNKFNQKISKRCKRLADILEKEDGLVENEVLRDNLRELAEMVAPDNEVNVPFSRFTYDEKKLLVNIIRGILKENEYMNKIRGKYKIIGNKVQVRGAEAQPTDVLDVSGAIEQAYEELKDTPKAKNLGFVSKFATSIQTPEAVFDRVGGHHKNNIAWQLWKMVEDAQEDEWEYERKLYSIIEPVLSETDKVGRLRAKELQKYDSKSLVDLGVKGLDADGKEVNVKVTRGIMLDIYSHATRAQNLRHLAIGAYIVPDLKGYYKNDMDKAFGKGQIIIPGITKDISTFNKRIREARDNDDLAKADELTNQKYNLMEWQTDKWKEIANTIRSKLTEYELSLLEAGNKAFQESGTMLGKTSDQMYGVDLFDDENGVKDYYPMHVDQAYLGADIDYGAGIETNLGTSGFAQRRVNSDKPLLGGDYVNNLLNHIAKTAKYYAYLIPQHNMNNVLNGQVKGYSENFKKLLEQRDKAALKYIDNWKQDMFGGGGVLHDGLGELISQFTGFLRRNYAPAVLNLNPSVAIYQHLSFFMFLVEAGYKNTAKGLVLGGRNKDIRKMVDEATNFLWDRDKKGGLVETQTLKMENGFIPDTIKYINRVTKGHLDWIHNSDMRTVTRGGAVAKFELLDQGYNPSDVEEWNKQFREVYRRMMRTGQPLADTVHRPEIQRSNHEIVKFVAMFYTVRLQMLNTMMLENARYRVYKNDFKEGKYNTTKEDVDNQKGRARRSIIAVLLSQGSVVAAKMLIAGLLYHQNYDFTDEDGNVTAQSIALGFVKGTAKSMIELIPLTSEIEKLADTIVGVLSGNTYSSRYEGVSLSGIDAFKDMINNFAQDLKKIISGNYDVSKDIDKDLKFLSQFLGIPYGSLSKVIKGGLIGTYNDLKDDSEFNFSDTQTDAQKLNLWIKGDLSDKDAKEYLVENNKQKISNAFKKLYLEGEIDDETVLSKMVDTGLWDSETRKQPTDSYIKGKIEWWDIENKYKDEYLSTLTPKGAQTAETRKVIGKIKNMPYENAFWVNPDSNTSWKSYKSPYEKLLNKIKKWHN